MARGGRFTPDPLNTQPRAQVTGPSSPLPKLHPAKVLQATQKLDAKLAKPNQAIARLGGKLAGEKSLAGPQGRLAALQEGYEKALAYTQPGMRGLLAALSGSFGDPVDPDTQTIVNLRQAGLGQLVNQQPPTLPVANRLGRQ